MIEKRVLVLIVTILMVSSSAGTLIVLADGENPANRTSDVDKRIVKIEVGSERASELSKEEDIEILQKYESFALVKTSLEQADRLEKKGLNVNRLPHRDIINIKGHEFKIDEGPQISQDMKIESYDKGEKGTYIIHMLGPVHPDWNEKLQSNGVELVDYVSNYAYVVRTTPRKKEQVEEFDFIDWVGYYHPAYKLDEGLKEGKVSINLLDDGSFTDDPLLSSLNVNRINKGSSSLDIIADVSDKEILKDIAQKKDVYHISRYNAPELKSEMESQIIGGGAWVFDDDDDPSTPYRAQGDHGAYFNQMGYTGEGVVTAVADTGVGDGSDGNAGHVDFDGRVIGGKNYNESKDNWKDEIGHGTHCAGMMAGDTYDGSGVEYAGTGPYYVSQGLASDSDIYAQRIFDQRGRMTVQDISKMLGDAKRNGAYVHSDSWGSRQNLGEYTSTDTRFDMAVRDADGEQDGNQPMVIIVAAGNEGDGEQTTASPGNAKNVITVGASESYMPNADDHGAQTPRQGSPVSSDNPDKIASFSSRGWTKDNRVKPTVAAPGHVTLSTSTPELSDSYLYGLYSEDNRYEWSSGTSMSTPAVAGATAALTEYYEDNYGERPSPAMVKALLVNTAHDLDDENGNTGPIPNKAEGWGLVNLAEVLEGKGTRVVKDQESVLKTGDNDTFKFIPADKNEPFKVTLTWTDCQASPDPDTALENDLDLKVTDPDGQTVYKGNAFDEDGDSVSDSGFTYPNTDTMNVFDSNDDGYDDKNVVENVYIKPDNLTSGAYTVDIMGKNIVRDGNNDGDVSQDYSLVVSNGAKERGAWPMSNLNLKNTGYSRYNTTSVDGMEKWRFTTGESIDVSPIIGNDGVIYLGSTEGVLYAIDSEDGSQIWKTSLGNDITSTPSIGPDGRIFAATLDGDLYCLSPQGGSQLWKASIGEPLQSSPTILDDGTIYIGSSNGNLYSFEKDGTERWAFSTDGAITTTPAISSDGTVYVGCEAGNLYAVQPDGNESWQSDIGSSIKSSPAINSQGVIYVGTDSNELKAIKPDGSEMWSYNTGDSIRSSPSIDDSDTGYVGSLDGSFYAVESYDGSQRWEAEIGADIRSSSAIGNKGIMYVGADDGSLYSIDTDDGTVLWNFTTKESIVTSPAIGSGSNVYVASRDGNLYKLGEDTIPPRLNITAPLEDSIIPTEDVPVRWDGEDNETGIEYYEARIDNGEWINKKNTEEHTFTGVEDGEHSVEVRGTDGAGNTALLEVKFIVDTTEPTIEITSPEGGNIFETDSVTVSWIITEETTEIVEHKIRIDSGEWENVTTTNRREFNGLEDGEHTVEIKATDEGNNTGRESVTFRVDTGPPTIDITSPEEGEEFDVDHVTVEWDGNDQGSGIDEYAVKIEYKDWIDVGMETKYTFTDLIDGEYTVNIRAWDGVNNSQTQKITFQVNAGGDDVTVEITEPEDGTKVEGPNVTVKWTSEKAEHHEVRIKGGHWKDVGSDNQYTFTRLPEDEYTLQVRAVDDNGWARTDEVTVTVEEDLDRENRIESVSLYGRPYLVWILTAIVVANIALVSYLSFYREKG
ncbi:MAG: PQQ-binding-like beta-propeller repeat protein [Candidatus Thermoplasmatota archaeon]|nr:PQQ-binding-like beta-propeller repeat protein [Candidatus Thermoplasmatota archaeon]